MYVVENTSGSATRDPRIHKLPLPAQTVVWNATLTSADNWALGSTYTYDGYGSSAFGSSIPTTQGSLSPDSFTVGTTTHTVQILGVREGTDNRLYLFTDTAVSKSDLAAYAMEFTVDGSTTTLKVKDATPESNLGFYWAASLHSFGPDDWQAKTITRDSPDQTTFPGYSSRGDTAKYNPAFQERQMRPDSLKFHAFIGQPLYCQA